jgi:zinc protease
MQMIHAEFTNVSKDTADYQKTIKETAINLRNRKADPESAFSDSVYVTSIDHHPRFKLLTEEDLANVSHDRILSIIQEQTSAARNFTFIFVGNINPNDPKVRDMICQWLGGLKTKKTREEVIDHHVTVAPGLQKNYFSRKMETTTASNRIQYTSYDMPFTLANDLNMEIIGRILSTRYLESIREREGGSYGVGTYGYMTPLPTPRAGLIMQFDTDPLKQERLMQIIHEEIQTIIANGPLESDLQKEKESMLKDFQEDLENNKYWRSALYEYYMFGINNIRDYKPAVEAITAETVQQTLKKLVEAGNMFEVVMFPEN